MKDLSMGVPASYLASAVFELQRTKRLGERALAQLRGEDEWRWRPDAESNSIAITVQHLAGNMLSRWTDFLTTDGEKPSRRRDAEFEPTDLAPARLEALWREGWACCLEAVGALTPEDLTKTVTIRGEPLTVIEALQRQISHYAYHVGQIVFVARWLRGADWESLSIPRGKSSEFTRGRYRSPGA